MRIASFYKLAFYFLGAFILIIDSIYNGYPIIYQDTSTYIANGFDLDTPIDKPITYCLFVRVFSINGLTLWTVIYAQAFILSFLLYTLLETLFDKRFNHLHFLIITSMLSLFTGVSWTASQVIADIFTPMLVLTIGIILLRTMKRKELFLMYFLFLLSTSMHLSHLVINATLILLLFSISFIRFKQSKFKISRLRLLTMLLITVVSFFTMNSAMAKSRHIFFMGAMAENGILKQYLSECCDDNNYDLCKYIHEIPTKGYEFVWDENSPVYKMGGWKAVENEFSLIIFRTLTTPRFILLHITGSLKATWRQLNTFKINDANRAFSQGDLVYSRFETYFPNELDDFISSKQNKNEFGFTDTLNNVYFCVVILSILSIIFSLIYGYRRLDSKILFIVILFVMGVLVNSWAAGTFANSIDRLGCKMIWLIPFASVILLMKIFPFKKKEILHDHSSA